MGSGVDPSSGDAVGWLDIVCDNITVKRVSVVYNQLISFWEVDYG